MISRILSGTTVGVDGVLVEVETDIAAGLPAFAVVGLPEGALRESKDRVKAAVKNSGYDFPTRRITVNLAPADVKKDGSGFDLPMALGILAAAGMLDPARLARYCILGELSLDGAVRPARGVLPIAGAVRAAGLTGIIVPRVNAREAAVVEGVEVIGVGALAEAAEFLAGKREIAPAVPDLAADSGAADCELDFAEVRGQAHVKRALEIAAAGGHNILMSGPPGAGKTMLARRLPGILPEMSFDEALATSRVYSVCGMLSPERPLLLRRPFRAPHHTVSDAGLVGGGQMPRPGEVSLAHNGVLFLDELPEFRKNVLEVLRQPLESGEVTISRALRSLSFPARFLLVAAMNPCPCGYLHHPVRACSCLPLMVQRYRGRISGPLLDRIDLHLEVPAIPIQELTGGPAGESSTVIRDRVVAARRVQGRRFAQMQGQRTNSAMGPREMKRFCVLTPESERLLERAVERLGLSARAYHRILKIARTVADLDHAADIGLPHVAEAIQFRRLEAEGA